MRRKKKNVETPEVEQEEVTSQEESEPSPEQDLSPEAKELADTKDQLIRLMAEFDNFKKRVQKEQSTSYQKGLNHAIASLLEVFDNLERASQTPVDHPEEMAKGIALILSQFTSALDKLNVTVIDPQGQPFDPESHNAVMHIEDPELPASTVCEVFQKGYAIGDSVIRFAMVKVAN